MPDSRNHRQLRSKNGSCHAFLVKRPQILHRAAAAPQNNHVCLAPAVRRLQAFHNIRRGCFSLHQCREYGKPHSRVASFCNLDNVAHRRPRRRGDYRNTADIFGNLPLIVRIKKSLCCKLFLHLLKGKLQGTHADRLQKFAVQLILPCPFVQGNMPV